MSAEGALLLTGASGFVGQSVLVRWLARDRRAVVLLRAEDDEAATARVMGVLDRLIGPEAARCAPVRALAADLTEMVPAALAQRLEDEDIGQIIHSAACVRFDLEIDEARAVNVRGTERMLDHAGRLHARSPLQRYVQVSTAYVAGRHTGGFCEADRWIGQDFRNTYEQSKLEAEQLVCRHADILPVQIVRPSIVVGERGTGWTRSFNVLYWPLKQFARGRLPVVPAVADAPVVVVPVDYVADVVLGLSDAPAGTYHAVAGEHASTVAEVIDLAAARFGVPAPEIVDPRVIDEALARPLAEPQRRALEQARIFFPYFRLGVRFDDRWARGILEPAGVACEPLPAYFDTLIDYAQHAAWGGGSHLTVTSGDVTVAA
jgi:nucleoside-diphosphate-sugar epimerase